VTASRLGLAVLTAVAALLALVVVLGAPPAGVVRSRQLVPGMEVERVKRVVIERAGEVITLEKGPTGWSVSNPEAGPADDAAVADLIGALAVAQWERALPAAQAKGLQPPRVVVTVDGARIAFGDAVAGADQVWARVGDGDALLVPSWVRTAVDRPALALRQTRLVPIAPEQVNGVEIHGRGADLVLAGAPLELRGAGTSVRVNPTRAATLLDALVGLRAIGVAGAVAQAPDGMSVRVLGGAAPVELIERGTCDGGAVRLEGSAGAVCVDAAAWAAIAAPAAEATKEPARWVDPRPLDPAAVAEIAWRRTGTTLRVKGGGFAVAGPDPLERPADDDAVRAALAKLAAPAPKVVPYAGAGAPVLDLRRRDGGADTIDLVRTPDGPGLRRNREPFALVGAPGLDALDLAAGDLRDRGLIGEEPSGLARLEIARGARTRILERGAVVGEWRSSAGPVDAAAVDAVAAALAGLRADRFLRDPALGAVRARLAATFDAPPVAGAAPGHHDVEIGAALPGGGCAARVDGAVVALTANACQVLLAVAQIE